MHNGYHAIPASAYPYLASVLYSCLWVSTQQHEHPLRLPHLTWNALGQECETAGGLHCCTPLRGRAGFPVRVMICTVIWRPAVCEIQPFGSTGTAAGGGTGWQRGRRWRWWGAKDAAGGMSPPCLWTLMPRIVPATGTVRAPAPTGDGAPGAGTVRKGHRLCAWNKP